MTTINRFSPIFFIALGLMLIFAVQFKKWGLPYLPTGADIWDRKDPVELIRHMALPVICLVIITTSLASTTRRLPVIATQAVGVPGLAWYQPSFAAPSSARVSLVSVRAPQETATGSKMANAAGVAAPRS